MKCVCPMGGDRTCPSDCPVATWENLSPTDRKAQRKAIAQAMHKRGMTPERIAKEQGIHLATTYRDLEFSQDAKIKKERTASNPKGAGRPKGSKVSKRGQSPKLDKARAIVRSKVESNEPIDRGQLVKEHGISSFVFQQAITAEEARKETLGDPTITPDMLSLTAQQKLEAAIRQHKRKLDAEFSQRVSDEIRSVLDQWLPQYQEKLVESERVLNAYQGIMSRAHFRKILACLHPDRGMSDQTLNEAFHIFEKLESVLVKKDELDKPRSASFDFPRTYEEAMQMKRDVAQERKSKRTTTANAVRMG